MLLEGLAPLAKLEQCEAIRLRAQLDGELTRSAEASHRSANLRSPTASGADNGFELGRCGFDIVRFRSLAACAAHFPPAGTRLSE